MPLRIASPESKVLNGKKWCCTVELPDRRPSAGGAMKQVNRDFVFDVSGSPPGGSM